MSWRHSREFVALLTDDRVDAIFRRFFLYGRPLRFLSYALLSDDGEAEKQYEFEE
jgi:hypothetical protein